MTDAVSYKIRVGVTGHRNNLPDDEQLRNRIQDILGIRDWENGFHVSPDSIFSLFDKASIKSLTRATNTPVSLSICSALAEGADRVVSEEILKTSNSCLKAVLPLTYEDYLKDFNTDLSRKQFNDLLEQDPFPVYLRSLNLNKQFESNEIDDRRRQAYFNVGKYVVDHCQILIAVWDGAPAHGKGGTADVVAYAIKKKKPVIIISSLDVTNVTIHKFSGLKASSINSLEYFNSLITDETTLSKYTDALNKDYFEDEKIPECLAIPEPYREAISQGVFPYYVKASRAGKHFKRLFKLSGVGSYLIAVIALVILLVSIVFKVLHHTAYIIEFILLLTILTTITFAHYKKVHKTWLQNRFLCERLRVAPYMFLGGLNVSGIADPVFSGSLKNDNWMIEAFEEIWRNLNQKWRNSNGNENKIPFEGLKNYVRKSWIQGQLNYHINFCRKNTYWNKFFKWGGRVLFAVAIITAALHINLYSNPTTKFEEIAERILTLLALSLPALAATFEGIRRHREYSSNIKRSENMIAALTEIDHSFEEISSKEELDNLLIQTDKLMLQENQDWMMVMVLAELEYTV